MSRVQGATDKERQDVLATNRQVLIQAVSGLALVGGLVFTALTLAYTARTTRATQDQVAAAQAQTIVARDQEVTARFTTGVEQLSSTKSGIRIGGIYAMERIVQDSRYDGPTVTKVLAAFVRNQAAPADQTTAEGKPNAEHRTPADVQAALTVLGRVSKVVVAACR
jgi:hypothetical protein